MRCSTDRPHGIRAEFRWIRREALTLKVAAVFVLAGAILATASAQQRTSASTSLVFDGVTVVDVEHGKLIPNQRLAIAGNHITSIENSGAVKVPQGAQVVNAQDKYLIPGLWDMHIHPQELAHIYYPLLIANGVTGIRDAGSPVPLDTLRLWRQEILAGTRVGPPRQVLSGPSIDGPKPDCDRSESRSPTCVADTADARRLVDSLKAAGADMIKPHHLSRELYFAVAAESRRLGIPFGGHADGPTADESSDSGASIIDHVRFENPWYNFGGTSEELEDLVARCMERQTASVEQCRLKAEKFRRQNTWITVDGIVYVYGSYPGHEEFWDGAPLPGQWLRDSVRARDSVGALSIMERVNFPILAGTDMTPESVTGNYGGSHQIPGFLLQANLVAYVAAGLTPLNALRSATLNPAKMLRATDSLGTVAPGKLADLVLLDANPLADITNITAIRAVVANGRYFDRAALDTLLADVRAKAKESP